jgi:hypothetical protein
MEDKLKLTKNLTYPFSDAAMPAINLLENEIRKGLKYNIIPLYDVPNEGLPLDASLLATVTADPTVLKLIVSHLRIVFDITTGADSHGIIAAATTFLETFVEQLDEKQFHDLTDTFQKTGDNPTSFGNLRLLSRLMPGTFVKVMASVLENSELIRSATKHIKEDAAIPVIEPLARLRGGFLITHPPKFGTLFKTERQPELSPRVMIDDEDIIDGEVFQELFGKKTRESLNTIPEIVDEKILPEKDLTNLEAFMKTIRDKVRPLTLATTALSLVNWDCIVKGLS